MEFLAVRLELKKYKTSQEKRRTSRVLPPQIYCSKCWISCFQIDLKIRSNILPQPLRTFFMTPVHVSWEAEEQRD